MGMDNPLGDHPPFIVSATEALLLGIAIEEYRRDRGEGYIGRLFVSYLMRWLKPFVPEFSRSRLSPIQSEQLPKDIEWRFTESRFGSGISPTVPNVLFLNPEEGSFFRFVFDISRRSLLDQVVSMLRNQIQIPDRYYINITPETTDQVIKAWHEVYSSPHSSSFESAMNEDAAKILLVLDQLVESSNQSPAFNLGRQFGRVFQELEMFKQLVFDAENDFSHWEQSRMDYKTGIESFEELKEEAQTAIKELQNGELKPVLELLSDELGWDQEAIEAITSFVKQESGDGKGKLIQLIESLINNHVEEQEMAINDQERIGDFEDCFHHHLDLSEVFANISESPPLKWSSHSPAMLKLKTQVSFEPENEESIRAAQTTAQEEMHELIAVTWMALGEVIGVLRENDKLFQQADCEETIPRAFSDWIRAPLDKIENLVLKCHQLLAQSPSQDPQAIINMLSPCVEALIKRAWGNRIGKREDGKVSMSGILKDKSENGDLLEKRFAATAKGVLDGIRHPSQHQFDDFNGTYEDARFLVSAVRYLVKLLQQMQSP